MRACMTCSTRYCVCVPILSCAIFHTVQYYIVLGGTRYVDLGLQTHRVKCRVHEDFKLVQQLSPMKL